MAAKGNKFPTLTDVAKRLAPDGSVDEIAEMLAASNPMVADAPLFEANDGTGHRTTMRTGIPTSVFRMMYQGVQPTKSQTVQQTDTCGMILEYAQVDKALAELNGNTTEFRLSEDRPHIEAISQAIGRTALYGNTSVAPQEFFGLAPRYSSLSAPNARNIIDAGGTGSDNTSMWFVVWGRNTCHMIYPKGSMAGISTVDKGVETVQDELGGYYEAYRTVYDWKGGLVLRDWRYVVRIANIDVSNLALAGESTYAGANLVKHMRTAYNRIQDGKFGRPIIYANRDVITALDHLANTTPQLLLTMGEYAGEPALEFRKSPIRMTDMLLNTESRVV